MAGEPVEPGCEASEVLEHSFARARRGGDGLGSDPESNNRSFVNGRIDAT